MSLKSPGREERCSAGGSRRQADSKTLQDQPQATTPSVPTPTPVMQWDPSHPASSPGQGSRYCKFSSSSFTSICSTTPSLPPPGAFGSPAIAKQSGALVCCCWTMGVFPRGAMTWLIVFAQQDRCLSSDESILNTNTGRHLKSYFKCHQSQKVNYCKHLSKNSTVGFLCQVIYFGCNFCLINRGFSSDLEGVRTSGGAAAELG